jgi:hypothetical protein
MTILDNSGPAFPTVKQVDRDGFVQVDANDGISARDYFAAKAMQPLITRAGSKDDWRELHSLAYAIADAMLAERAK